MNIGNPIICPLCNDPVDKLLYRYHIDGERRVIERIKRQNPEWSEKDGACSRCLDYYHTEVVMRQRMLPGVGPYFPIRSADDFLILPTGLRLDADQRYTGRGITICFIDSGFFPHPDLAAHRNRIKAIIDVTDNEKISKGDSFVGKIEDAQAWHGTMTSVVCAGDGYLSKGLYKGIASDAEVVLIKVQDMAGRISTENIARALNWVLAHHKDYGIRIVNMSLGDDEAISYKLSETARLCEKLVAAGVVVVAAAGNDINGNVKPPANSPGVITVGGLDDGNSLEGQNRGLYHSTYGKTIDGIMKPELTAQAIWIAAPILPGTSEHRESQLLHRMLRLPDRDLEGDLQTNFAQTGLESSVLGANDVTFIREAIVRRIQSRKYISDHYMHVDGTSFAAPIISSIAAQLLEVNPQLEPGMIREILFSSAKRIAGYPAERQGFGIVMPRKAILKTLARESFPSPAVSPVIIPERNTIEFYHRDESAWQVSLAGSFNQWSEDVLFLEPGRNGLWKIDIPMLTAGLYQYKFFVNESIWKEDMHNPFREPDGFNGFNSILDVRQPGSS
jgi:serine protease AprX